MVRAVGEMDIPHSFCESDSSRRSNPPFFPGEFPRKFPPQKQGFPGGIP